VINGQHAAKKPKLTNQLPDMSLEALTLIGPVASPVASQMSNMANPTKVIKISTRGRKNKELKVFIFFGNLNPGHIIAFNFSCILLCGATLFLNIYIVFVSKVTKINIENPICWLHEIYVMSSLVVRFSIVTVRIY
jgi:hypothetical protein